MSQSGKTLTESLARLQNREQQSQVEKKQVDPDVERKIVFDNEPNATATKPEPKTTSTSAPPQTSAMSVQFSTKMRADVLDGLKRMSLERKLNKQEGSNIKDILEEALIPILHKQGYLAKKK